MGKTKRTFVGHSAKQPGFYGKDGKWIDEEPVIFQDEEIAESTTLPSNNKTIGNMERSKKRTTKGVLKSEHRSGVVKDGSHIRNKKRT